MNEVNAAIAESLQNAPQTPAATVEKPQGFGPVAGVSKDRDGRVFDAAKFLPEKDHNGRWKRIGGPGRPGRPPGSKSKPKVTETPQQPAPDFSDVDRVIHAARNPPPAPGAAAQPGETPLPMLTRDTETNATAESIIGILQMLLVLIGEEEGVLSELEKNLLRPPILRLLKKYEVADDFMPEEVELAIAVAGIVIDRIRKGGKTATWFAKAKAWALNMVFRGKGALLGRDARREMPESMVDKLAARVEELQAELARKSAQPSDPTVVQFST
jgi:hypothetical protein